MSTPGFYLRHLVFLRPQRSTAPVKFGPGLNVVYGASNTGKSFLVEAIDFMLGGGRPLRDIPERVGYDRVLLGIETFAGATHTIYRSIDGGRFRLYAGLHTEMPADGAEVRDLAEHHAAGMRATYAELADKRGEVREALTMLRTLQDVQRRREALDQEIEKKPGSTITDGDLPTAVAQTLALRVETILKAWHFPDAERVFFDPKARDFIIAGKPRSSYGKGLRAITYAAFALGLQEYCRAQETPHPGFVVLDSPLLAYRAPEGTEDDLRGTDLDTQFYTYLESQRLDRQTIIVENDDPPNPIKALPQTTMFTGNPHTGRFGLFPPLVPPRPSDPLA